MTPRDLAAALALTTVIADAAKARKDDLRAALAAALDDVGADSVRAELPDGTRVAKSTLITPNPKPVVSDEAAFAGWVEGFRPDEIVRTVRDSYKRVILERLASTPDGTAIDPETGEVVPGVRFSTGATYVSTRFEKDGRDAIVTAIRDGAIEPAAVLSALSTTPALPGGNT
jgi:plasmid stabilization system protein ParE